MYIARLIVWLEAETPWTMARLWAAMVAVEKQFKASIADGSFQQANPYRDEMTVPNLKFRPADAPLPPDAFQAKWQGFLNEEYPFGAETAKHARWATFWDQPDWDNVRR